MAFGILSSGTNFVLNCENSFPEVFLPEDEGVTGPAQLMPALLNRAAQLTFLLRRVGANAN